jgi:hypothetical protein
MLEIIENEYISISVNCAKTVLRIYERTKDIKTKIDYSQKQIQDSIDELLGEKPTKLTYTVLASVCNFCIAIGGLESLGLIYSNEEIQSALFDIARVTA